MQDQISEIQSPSPEAVQKTTLPSVENPPTTSQEESMFNQSQTTYHAIADGFKKSFDELKVSSQTDISAEEAEFKKLEQELDEIGKATTQALEISQPSQKNLEQPTIETPVTQSSDGVPKPARDEQQSSQESVPSLEEEISTLEKKLGIETPLQRVVEASLLIDSKFLRTGVISGQTDVERIFGDEAWRDWLAARLAAREYGTNSLTVEFITKLHEQLTSQTNPKISGHIRTLSLVGGDYKNLGASVLYTEEQFNALQENPLLGFKQIGSDPRNGLIVYPHANPDMPVQFDIERLQLSPQAQQIFENNGKTTEGLLRGLLTDLCTWYSTVLTKSDHDPYALAADLQRKLVSIHPFNDVNGRLSRLLMDWSLENDKALPSVLEEPSDDILTSQEQWQEEVKTGSLQYGSNEWYRMKLERIGYANAVEMMNLSDAYTFYQNIGERVREAPEQLQHGEPMSHSEYEEFLADLKREQEQFEQNFTALREKDMNRERLDIKQGGLIPKTLIDLLRITPQDTHAYNTYVRDNFFRDHDVFRGAICQNRLGEEDIVRMFQEPVGFGSGYKALADAFVSPLSSKKISPEIIAKSLEYYNDLVSTAYINMFHPEVKTGDTIIPKNFVDVISLHLGSTNNKQYSPFASTSLNFSQGIHWSNPNITTLPNPKHGILFIAQTPVYGTILGFGRDYFERNISDIPAVRESDIRLSYPSEEEVMVPGAVFPPTIKTILLYDKDEDNFGPQLIAQRGESKTGEETIIVANMRDKKQALYVLDKTGKFVLQPGSEQKMTPQQFDDVVRTVYEKEDPLNLTQPIEKYPVLTEAQIEELKKKFDYLFTQSGWKVEQT